MLFPWDSITFSFAVACGHRGNCLGTDSDVSTCDLSCTAIASRLSVGNPCQLMEWWLSVLLKSMRACLLVWLSTHNSDTWQRVIRACFNGVCCSGESIPVTKSVDDKLMGATVVKEVCFLLLYAPLLCPAFSFRVSKDRRQHMCTVTCFC